MDSTPSQLLYSCSISSLRRKHFMESITLVAPDISCEHCQHAIEGAVSMMDGVQTVNVDIPTKMVHVEYNPQQVTTFKLWSVFDRIMRDEPIMGINVSYMVKHHRSPDPEYYNELVSYHPTP